MISLRTASLILKFCQQTKRWHFDFRTTATFSHFCSKAHLSLSFLLKLPLLHHHFSVFVKCLIWNYFIWIMIAWAFTFSFACILVLWAFCFLYAPLSPHNWNDSCNRCNTNIAQSKQKSCPYIILALAPAHSMQHWSQKYSSLTIKSFGKSNNVVFCPPQTHAQISAISQNALRPLCILWHVLFWNENKSLASFLLPAGDCLSC